MREWYGAFPDWGPLAEDSVTKLNRGQLNVCTVYVYCVCILCLVYSFPTLWLNFEPGWPAIFVGS